MTDNTTPEPIVIHPDDFDAITSGTFCLPGMTRAAVKANELWGRLLRGLDGGIYDGE